MPVLACSQCSAAVPEQARFCPSCGGPAGPSVSRSQSPTMFSSSGAALSHSSGSRSRFVAGEILAGRYRIEGLLGRGGMGEVYKAEDIKIGSIVALKFLPASLQRNATMLARFHNEVRLARQVTHANVCRVHDIGDIAGAHYLSMEYVDGENLASLLRRIGRLPGDKAIDIARQICAGLAAAHERGVLHRDLKPENVMLDGQGRVRLMDFGLAAVREELSEDDLRSGTPAYMAPEQLEGRALTVRSDLYGLGLVLHEMFTGRQIFDAPTLADLKRQRQSFTPERATLTTIDADPAVEKVIRRCLEADPELRPPSALAVAMALPGGDPLHAALAAGELPSPEMVAAAGAIEGIPPARAAIATVLLVAGLVAMLVSTPTRTAAGRAPVALPPEALADRARTALRGAGLDAPAADRAFGFQTDREAVSWLRANGPAADPYTAVTSLRVGATRFWYRQAPRPLEPRNMNGIVTRSDPNPAEISGAGGVQLDEAGRLLSLFVVPPQVPDPAPTEIPATDWKPLFDAAQLDPARFQPAEPERLPNVFADARFGWKGAWPETPEIPIQIEGASFRGKPVWFEVVRPWSRPAQMQTLDVSMSERVAMNLNIALVLSALIGAGWIAKRAVSAGRADTRGAWRVAATLFVLSLIGWGCTTHHQRGLQEEFQLFLQGVAGALLTSALCCVLYLALEPVVRKRLPHALLGWSRLTAGRIRDPLVARDVLFGFAAFGAVGIAIAAVRTLIEAVNPSATTFELSNFDGTLGLFAFVGQVANLALNVLLSPMLILFLITFFELILTSKLAALVFRVLKLTRFTTDARMRTAARGICFVLLGIVVTGARMSTMPLVAALLVALFAVSTLIFVVTRFGLLALMAMTFPNLLLFSFPLTLDTSRWFFGYSVAAVAVVVVLALAAVRIAVGANPSGQAARA